MTFGERPEDRPELTLQEKLELAESSFKYVCHIRDEAIKHMMDWKFRYMSLEKSVISACESTGCSTVEELRRKCDAAVTLLHDVYEDIGDTTYGDYEKIYYSARLKD